MEKKGGRVGGSGRDESKARYRPSVFYQSVSPPSLFIFIIIIVNIYYVVLLSIIDTN